MAVNFVGGIPFQVLYDSVKMAIRKTRKFKTHLKSLQFTLDSLEPLIIEQIGDNNVQLNLPNNIIQDLQTKMEEGKELVDILLKLSMWNIRIWGNCYNCIGPDYAEQLGDLDISLKTLIGRLEWEQRRNVTELIMLGRNTNDKQDELDKKLDRICDILMAQNNATERVVSNSVQPVAWSSRRGGVAAPTTPAPALGVVFQQLFDVVIRVKVKNMMFKRLLKRFESTLDCLQPLIEEMVEYNRILHLSEQEVKNLTEQIKNGVELVHKCSKVRKQANYKKYVYTNKILDLNDSLQKLFIRLKVQVERDVKKAMDSANKIEAKIQKIEAGGLVQIDEHGSKGQSPVAQPGIVPRPDVIKEDSAPIIDQEGGEPNEGMSIVVQNQMEAEGIDEVVDSTRNMRETMDHVTLKGTLDFARNIEMMGVEKIEGSGESQTEIAVAETETPSPTVAEIATAEPLSSSNSSSAVELTMDPSPTRNTKAPIKQPEQEKETILEHLKWSANVSMTSFKTVFGALRKSLESVTSRRQSKEETTSRPISPTSRPVSATNRPISATSSHISKTKRPISATRSPIFEPYIPTTSGASPYIFTTSRPNRFNFMTNRPIFATSHDISSSSRRPIFATRRPPFCDQSPHFIDQSPPHFQY